jgi:hypothetical protein
MLAVAHGQRTSVYTFKPGEVPTLELGLGDFEVGCSILRRGLLVCKGKGKCSIGSFACSFTTIDWSVYLQSNVKILASEEIGSAIEVSNWSLPMELRRILIWRKDTACQIY